MVKAVIPAAGLGNRFHPLTRVIPKEMLPAGRKPLIHHVVEEAAASGIEDLCIVLRSGKEIIRDYFERLQPGELRAGPGSRGGIGIHYAFQEKPLGLGDALLAASGFVGDEPFVMMIPDQLFFGPQTAIRQLLANAPSSYTIFGSLVEIERPEARHFAGARSYHMRAAGERLFHLDSIKNPGSERKEAGEIAGFGRTLFSPEVFKYLGPEYTNPATGEVDLLLTREEIASKEECFGVLLDGRPMDLGTWDAYLYFVPRIILRMNTSLGR